MKVFRSIRFKIYMIFILFLVTPLLAITIVSNGFIQRALIEQTRINDLKTINTINSSINQLLRATELAGVVLQNNEDLIKFMVQAVKKGENDKTSYMEMDSRKYTLNVSELMGSPITIIDVNGIPIGEKALDKSRITYFTSKSFIKSLSSEEVTWSRMFHVEDARTGKIIKVLPAIFPIKNEQDILLGYAMILIDERLIYKEMAQYKDRIYILDLHNKIVSHQDPESIFDDFYAYSNINYSYLLTRTTTISNNNDRKTVVTTQNFGKFDWQTVILTDFDEMLAEANYDKNYITIVFILVSLLFIVFAVFISYFISRPIYNITKTMRAVEQGNLDIRNNYKANDEVGMLSSSLNRMLDRISELIEKNKTEQSIKRKTQLQLIQSQIKPHFLYNTLEMIASFIRENMKDLGLKSINSLSRFYRVSLSDGMDVITVRQEVDLIENYLILQKLRYIDFIDYEMDIDSDILEYSLPKFTIQPFIENAIYHGLRNKGSKGLIKLRGYKQGNIIHFEVFDDGLGMSEEKIAQLETAMNCRDISDHFGISSVAKRLELLFGEAADIMFYSEEGKYTKVVISFAEFQN